MARKALIIVVAIPALLVAACGPFGSDDEISMRDSLRVAQDRTDIQEYCLQRKAEAPLDPGILLYAINDLIEIYRETPDSVLKSPALEVGDRRSTKLTVRQVLRREVSVLRKCGREGKAQATRLINISQD